MSGPEELPYAYLGARADAASAAHNLDGRQTFHFLIDKIPEEALSFTKDETYTQLARISDQPDDPSYIDFLDSIAWANRIDKEYEFYSNIMGTLGACMGIGAVAAAEPSIFSTRLI